MGPYGCIQIEWMTGTVSYTHLAWIVAAYEEIEDVEGIEDPWRNIISRGKYYHNVRVRGDKKNTVTYAAFLSTLYDNWDKVVEKCYSAKIFDQEIKKFIAIPQ